MMRVGFEHGNSRPAQPVEMPLSEMASGVARMFHRLRQRLLLMTQRATVRIDARAVVRPAGQHASAGRRADRPTRVEAVESQSVGGHGVEVGGLQQRVVVVTGLAPALVIRHHEDDVRFLACRCVTGERHEYKHENQTDGK